jgi:hypothetical protein
METHLRLWCERPKERSQRGELDVGGSIILSWVIVCIGMDCIDVAQVRDQRTAFVNTVMNLGVS